MENASEKPVMQYAISGSGPPLVLVPGGLTGWISWIPHAEVLSQTRRVIRVQLLNVALGLAEKPLPEGYSAAYEAGALGNTLDLLGIRQADFAAWSYSALIALSFAVNNPRRVRTLTLIEPPAFWLVTRAGPLSPRDQQERDMLESMAGGRVSEDQLAEFTHVAGFVPREVDPRTLAQWPVWVQHRNSLRMGGSEYRHNEDMALLHAFDRPVLIVKGEGSNPTIQHIADLLGEALPHARVIELPGGHAAHIVSMQAFLEELHQVIEPAAQSHRRVGDSID